MRIGLWLTFFVLLGNVSGIAQAERPGYITVLHYQWYDDPWRGKNGTPLETFQEQMAFLKQGDYRVVPLSVLRRMYELGEPLLEKMVGITIEGSDRMIYETIYPILKSHGYASVFFPIVKALDSTLPDGLTWQMVESLHASGVDIGVLPYQNSHLGVPEDGQNRLDYRLDVRAEILNAQRAFAVHGIKTDVFAYAHGEYNADIIQEAKILGFRLMFTRDRGALDARTMPVMVPRMVIASAMDLERFVFNLNMSPLHVADVRPDAGFMSVNPPSVFSVRLLEPQRYRPGVVNMFVSEWGRVEAEYDATTGLMVFRPGETLQNEQNRLTVTAREAESEHYSIFSSLYLHPFETLSQPVP